MPEPSNHYEPTDADIDMVLEDATGNPVKPENLTAGINSLRKRIAQLESEKSRLLGQLDDSGQRGLPDLDAHITALNQVLSETRQRLADYMAQFGKVN